MLLLPFPQPDQSTLVRSDFLKERTLKEQRSGRKKMTIGVGFKFLKILVGREARNRMRVPKTRKQTIKTKHKVSFN